MHSSPSVPGDSEDDHNNYVDTGISGMENDIVVCEHCPERFEGKRNLMDHVRRMHSNELRPYQCGHCKKRFTKSGYLNNHLATHDTTKCEHCSKRIKGTKRDLMHHVRSMHSKELRPYISV